MQKSKAKRACPIPKDCLLGKINKHWKPDSTGRKKKRKVKKEKAKSRVLRFWKRFPSEAKWTDMIFWHSFVSVPKLYRKFLSISPQILTAFHFPSANRHLLINFFCVRAIIIFKPFLQTFQSMQCYTQQREPKDSSTEFIPLSVRLHPARIVHIESKYSHQYITAIYS